MEPKGATKALTRLGKIITAGEVENRTAFAIAVTALSRLGVLETYRRASSRQRLHIKLLARLWVLVLRGEELSNQELALCKQLLKSLSAPPKASAL